MKSDYKRSYPHVFRRSKIFVWASRRQLVPFCWTFSISRIYPSQPKILEDRTKDEMLIFEALFKGVSTRFGLRIVEKLIETPHFIFCSVLQNLRLGSIEFRQKCQLQIHLEMFVEMENVQQKGTSCRRLFGRRKVLPMQPSATSPLFFDNLPPLGRTFRQTFYPSQTKILEG